MNLNTLSQKELIKIINRQSLQLANAKKQKEQVNEDMRRFAHDVRHLAGAPISYISLAEHELDDEYLIKEKERLVEETCLYICKFTSDFLDHGLDQVASFDVQEVIEEIAFGDKRVEITVPEPIQMKSYPEQLKSIILNFIANSKEADRSSHISISATNDNYMVNVVLQDNIAGGMPTEILDQYRSLKAIGRHGNGLPLMRESVIRMKGESDLKQCIQGEKVIGTQFHMNLPRIAC